jgi:transcriptional regulator with XRE-family HTH domain
MSQSEEPIPDLQRLAKAVVAVRHGTGLTQERLAELAGVSPRHIQELESGRLNASYLVVAAVARAFGVSLSYLVGIAEGQGAEVHSSGSESKPGK